MARQAMNRCQGFHGEGVDLPPHTPPVTQLGVALSTIWAVRVVTRYAPPLSSSPCGRRSASRRRADRRACRRQRSSSFPRSIRSHADRCSCLCVNAAASKPAWWPWPLTFWPWKWCPSNVYNFGLPRPLSSRVIHDVRDRQTSDRRQTKASLNASALTGLGHNKCRFQERIESPVLCVLQ